MTAAQQKWFNTALWPRACSAQGWKTSDRENKLRVVGQIIGREIDTTKDVSWDQEFDKLKTELQLLANPDSLAAALRTVTGPRDEKRKRLLHKLTQFDAPLVAKLTHNFSKGQIGDPAELPDNLLAAVVVTCEQIKRGKRYPVKKKSEVRSQNSESETATVSCLLSPDSSAADPFLTGQTPF